jgi:CDP-glucose 4,6-dehydratase
LGQKIGALADVGVTKEFWNGRRVFLTGHTGFKGSWLLLMLKELGAEVTGFALPPPTSPSLFDLLGLENTCRHMIGDIRDLSALDSAIVEARPEVVIHMAAQPLVRASYDQPVETYATNVMGTVHVLDACRRAPEVKSIVVVTTDKCYENLGWTWGYRENDRLGGADPYSNSKAACELVVDSYRRSFFAAGAAVGSARAGNVIGGGDFAVDRLLPDAAKAFMAGEPLSIRNPLSVRPWQHVIEPLSGYLLLAERLYEDRSFADGWNFGPRTEESATVREVAECFAGIWGGGARWEQDPSEHPHEASTLKLDSTKARLQLGWSPRLTVDQAVRLTADWYLAFQAGDDMRGFTERQIAAYLG